MDIQLGEWRGLPNAGGIRRLQLVRLPDVVSLTPPTTGVQLGIGSMVLTDTAEIIDIRFAERSCSYQINESEAEAGESYDAQVTADIPKIRADVLGFLRDRSQYRWIAFAEDFNGNCLVLGDPACEGLRMLLSYSSGSKPSDRNAQRIALTGVSWLPNLFSFVAEFSSEFSYEFNII